MRIKLFHNHYDKEHLQEVIEEMKIMGTPTIKVYHEEFDCYIAIEGCHRLRACKELGITPNIKVLTDDNFNDEYITDENEILTVGDMLDAFNNNCSRFDTVIAFDED